MQTYRYVKHTAERTINNTTFYLLSFPSGTTSSAEAVLTILVIIIIIIIIIIIMLIIIRGRRRRVACGFRQIHFYVLILPDILTRCQFCQKWWHLFLLQYIFSEQLLAPLIAYVHRYIKTGVTFHPDFLDQICPSQCLDSTWRRFCATVALTDFVNYRCAIRIFIMYLCMYLYVTGFEPISTNC